MEQFDKIISIGETCYDYFQNNRDQLNVNIHQLELLIIGNKIQNNQKLPEFLDDLFEKNLIQVSLKSSHQMIRQLAVKYINYNINNDEQKLENYLEMGVVKNLVNCLKFRTKGTDKYSSFKLENISPMVVDCLIKFSQNSIFQNYFQTNQQAQFMNLYKVPMENPSLLIYCGFQLAQKFSSLRSLFKQDRYLNSVMHYTYNGVKEGLDLLNLIVKNDDCDIQNNKIQYLLLPVLIQGLYSHTDAYKLSFEICQHINQISPNEEIVLLFLSIIHKNIKDYDLNIVILGLYSLTKTNLNQFYKTIQYQQLFDQILDIIQDSTQQLNDKHILYQLIESTTQIYLKSKVDISNIAQKSQHFLVQYSDQNLKINSQLALEIILFIILITEQFDQIILQNQQIKHLSKIFQEMFMALEYQQKQEYMSIIVALSGLFLNHSLNGQFCEENLDTILEQNILILKSNMFQNQQKLISLKIIYNYIELLSLNSKDIYVKNMISIDSSIFIIILNKFLPANLENVIQYLLLILQ